MESYSDVNAGAIDQWVADGWEWGIPISHDEYAKALSGEWNVLLTPQKPVPKDWFPSFKAADLLGLASGGGQQMPIFSALGAKCTVFDYSGRQLQSERIVAEREGYCINIVKGDMTKRLPFEDESFDIIFHPVSNCYVEDVHHVWRECFRVLKSGGVLLSGMDNGINYLFEEDDPLKVVNKLPYNPLKDANLYERSIAADGSLQFSHTIQEQLGGQLKAGFMLTNLYEDTDSSEIGRYVPLFIATRAVKS